MDYYTQIFKRKSFHIFRDIEMISNEEKQEIEHHIQSIQSLYPFIQTKIEIVEEEKTTCKRGGQYCLLFYSEVKEGYLANIGYLGEQMDLYLCSKNIGTLWFGIGKPEELTKDSLDFVIMMCIAKMPEASFRKDMFKAKRKSLEEIWKGDILGISNIVRFSPSACNTQPWIVENKGQELWVYRYKKPGKRGIMPIHKVSYYNKIDIGIFLFILETCLKHDQMNFNRILFEDAFDEEKTLVAKYHLMD
ncbi:nitroreductase family protein [Floccifex sp.]|uniref:nitroreductase family protein n=1 Tax=Floccifex sp. TaxID=2815810 RepID=UPI003F045556